MKYTGLFFLIAACFLMISVLHGCTIQAGQTAENIIGASLDAVGTQVQRRKIQNLVSIADCTSPNGKYTTEIHTASGGYSFFKQDYTYKPLPFEAVIESKTKGYTIGDSIKPLNKEAIYTIRSHEFQNIVLEPDKWFHDFEKPEKIETDSLKMYELKAKDELNHPCLLFFDADSKLLIALHIQNPDDANEVLIIKFSNWKKIQGLQMPYYVEIDQSEKKFSFNFIKLQFNSPDFKYKNIKNERQDK